jgi:hypothetical protein
VLAQVPIHKTKKAECYNVSRVTRAEARLYASFISLSLNERSGIIASLIKLIQSLEDRVEIALLCCGLRHRKDQNQCDTPQDT